MKTREEVLAAIEVVADENDEQFHNIVRATVTCLDLSDTVLAEEFSISRPSVARWINGVTAPHPAMRKFVYEFLKKLLKEVE